MNKNIQKSLVLFVSTFVLLSCGLSRITVQHDEIMNSKRISFKTTFWNNTKDEPSYSQDINFMKEIDRFNVATYTLFDIIKLPYESFELSDKMYIIVNKDVFPLEKENKDNILGYDVHKKTSQVMQADSTYATVVTGQDVMNMKVTRMVHPLSQEIIDKISSAGKVYLRYYIGPEMITSEIKGNNLSKIKSVINSR